MNLQEINDILAEAATRSPALVQDRGHYDFSEQLRFSEGKELGIDSVLTRVASGIPSFDRWERADQNDDRMGTDYWIHRIGDLRSLSVDMKNRRFCPIKKRNSDDVCIETTSVYKGKKSLPWKKSLRKKIGWTLDVTKQTDIIVYTWPAEVGRRFWAVPFYQLCQASRENFSDWRERFGPEVPTPNKGYLTLNLYVPRSEVIEKMQHYFTGVA